MNNEQRGYYRAIKRDEERMNEGGSTSFFFVLSGESVGSTHERQSLYSQACQPGFSPYNLIIFNSERRENRVVNTVRQGMLSSFNLLLYINIHFSPMVGFTDVTNNHFQQRNLLSFRPSPPIHLVTNRICRWVEIMGK